MIASIACRLATIPRQHANRFPIMPYQRLFFRTGPPFQPLFGVDRFFRGGKPFRENEAKRTSSKGIARDVDSSCVLRYARVQVARDARIVCAVGAENHVDPVPLHVRLLRRVERLPTDFPGDRVSRASA